MAYVRFHSSFLNDTVDEFLFANYLETDSKGEKKVCVWESI